MSGCTSGLHAAEPKTGKMYRTRGKLADFRRASAGPHGDGHPLKRVRFTRLSITCTIPAGGRGRAVRMAAGITGQSPARARVQGPGLYVISTCSTCLAGSRHSVNVNRKRNESL